MKTCKRKLFVTLRSGFYQVLGYDDVASSCYPLIENGTNLLNPCGLIANSLFNGIYFMYASRLSLSRNP